MPGGLQQIQKFANLLPFELAGSQLEVGGKALKLFEFVESLESFESPFKSPAGLEIRAFFQKLPSNPQNYS